MCAHSLVRDSTIRQTLTRAGKPEKKPTIFVLWFWIPASGEETQNPNAEDQIMKLEQAKQLAEEALNQFIADVERGRTEAFIADVCAATAMDRE